MSLLCVASPSQWRDWRVTQTSHSLAGHRSLQTKCHFLPHNSCSCCRNSWWVSPCDLGFHKPSRCAKKLSLCMLSKAFSESMKFTWSCLDHSAHCSMMFRRVKIHSVKLLPFLNPACSFLNVVSTAVDILLMITLERILLGIDRRVIPRQLLQSLRVLFFVILIITPLVQSSGMQASVQIILKSGSNIPAAVSGSILNSWCLDLSLFLEYQHLPLVVLCSVLLWNVQPSVWLIPLELWEAFLPCLWWVSWLQSGTCRILAWWFCITGFVLLWLQHTSAEFFSSMKQYDIITMHVTIWCLLQLFMCDACLVLWLFCGAL